MKYCKYFNIGGKKELAMQVVLYFLFCFLYGFFFFFFVSFFGSYVVPNMLTSSFKVLLPLVNCNFVIEIM